MTAGSVGTAELAAGAVTTAKIAAGAVATAELAAGAVTGAKLGTGVVKQNLMNGVDETGSPSYTVAGMATGDEVVGFIVFTTRAAIATAAQRPASDFTPGTGALAVSANAADNSANQVLLTWISHQ